MKLNLFKSRKPVGKKAFTLIELSIVLVIIGVILAGVFVTASSAMNNNKKQQLLQEAVQVVQNAKNMFSNSSNTAGFDTTSLINGGAVPSQYVNGNNINHPFTTTTGVQGITAGADGSGTYYQINFNGVPKDACVQLITNIAGSADLMTKNGINGVGTTATASAPSGYAVFSASTAPTPALITAACAGTTTNSVGFQFQP